jgi:hypothetical protein
MKQRFTVQVIVGIVVVVFLVGTWLKSRQIDLGWLKYFSTAVFVVTLVLAGWDVLIWRIPIVQRIPGIPRCIRGTWKGTLTSFWVDSATNSSPPPKTVYLVVRQTATAVSVRLLTDESRSTSYLGQIQEIDGSVTLAYIYLNRPEMSVEHRSRMHYGSAVFDISGLPATRLQGRYWTDRDSKGELDFVERRQRLADDFSNAENLFQHNH